MPEGATLQSIHLEPRPDGCRLSLSGTVNIMLAEDLLGAARRADPAGAVEVDLGEAEHLDTAALQVLLALREAVRGAGGTWAVTQVPDGVRRYLRLAGLEPALLGITPA